MKKIDYFVAEYFKKTKKIAEKKFTNKIVTMQFFQRIDNSILCGMTEVLQLLKNNSDTTQYTIRHLKDGDHISAFEPVLILEGPYHLFGLFEGIIDGILARQTSLASNAHNIIQVSNKIPIIAMTDRADHYLMLESDGYALSIGGIKNFI
jgi:nicotinate phosphoribosyltransferase